MPLSLKRLRAYLPAVLSRPQPIYIAAAAVVYASAVFGGAPVHSAAAAAPRVPLYPSAPLPVAVIDASTSTVAELVESLPITQRFGLLLSNTGVIKELDGPGPYTLLAPADNAIDYLPYDVYVGATRREQYSLAQRHVISGLVVPLNAPSYSNYLTLGGDQVEIKVPGDGSAFVGKGFVIHAYRAQNGVVYVINSVLVPQLR